MSTSEPHPLPNIPSTADPDFWIRTSQSPTELCLGYQVDTYGGVIIDSTCLPDNSEEFRRAFQCSLNVLADEGFDKGYWIRIPISLIDFVPVCIKEYSFYIHHARRDYVMLVRWNHPSRPNPIPQESTHQVGVGCVITRKDGSLLLVKEKTGPAAVGVGIWKLPTGLVDPPEELGDAAMREAKEETGLDCEFNSIIAFRHSHGGSPALGASSDLFFACSLRLVNEKQQPVLQEAEILDAKWVHHSELHEVTQCGLGTAAWELMERVRKVVSGESACVVKGAKLPAWRRRNCEQWIYHPTLVTNSSSQ